MGPAPPFAWLGLAPFVAANALAAWTGWRGSNSYSGVLTAVCVDLAAGMLGLLMVGFSLVQFYGIQAFIPLLIAGSGLGVAVAVERSTGVMNSALPVRGEWGRRFLAGCAVLLLQPASPGVLYPAFVLAVQQVSLPLHWLGLWFISAMFYLTPVYRRIVTGVPAHVDLSRSHAQATTLSEFLDADAVTNPNVSRSFARFVVRSERSIYRKLVETGREPDDAGRRCRGLLRELWFDPQRSSYDHLEVAHLEKEIEDRNGPQAPTGCESLLLDLALVDLPPGVQALTHDWVETGDDFFALKTAAGLHRNVVSRRVHHGIGEALSRIALALPAKHRQGNRSSGDND